MHNELHKGLILSFLKYLGPEVQFALQGLFLSTIHEPAGQIKAFIL